MTDTRCGLSCKDCTYREPCNCKGCIATNGNPFHGECPVAACCQKKGFTHCGECPDIPCELLSQYSCDPEHGDTPSGARIERCKRLYFLDKIRSLRIERQHLDEPCDEKEYTLLYRDTQPGYNVYWNGFGQPPTLSFRAGFDDLDFNKRRQLSRELIKGRFCGGNLGWIEPCDLELFVALYKKPITDFTPEQQRILTLLEQHGALNIQQLKEETGYLVKEITPILHRLQEAFLVYEDQYDGEWDRGWCLFSEMFPDLDSGKFPTRHDALKEILVRFAYRNVLIDSAMAKSFYKLPEREIKAAIASLVSDGTLTEVSDGYILTKDTELLASYTPRIIKGVYALHRNDFLVKSFEHIIKPRISSLARNLPYDRDILQYLLVDGEFVGATVGHFRNGPYDLCDVVLDCDCLKDRKAEIIEAVMAVNFGKAPERFCGVEL